MKIVDRFCKSKGASRFFSKGGLKIFQKKVFSKIKSKTFSDFYLMIFKTKKRSLAELEVKIPQIFSVNTKIIISLDEMNDKTQRSSNSKKCSKINI